MAFTRTISFSKSSSFDFYRRKQRRQKLLLAAFFSLVLSLAILFAALLQGRTAGAAQVIYNPEADVRAHLAGNITTYVTTRYIKAGTLISEHDFQEQYWPRLTSPAGAVRTLDALLGKYAKIDIPSGEAIRVENLVNEKRFVSLPITPGMRAVTIDVDSQSSLEGWAQPGTKVDVTLTYVQGEGLTSKVIVQNAKVLSYAGDSRSIQERFGSAYSGSVEVGKTITLEVSPGDALKIQTSKKIGSLSLLMRAPEDDRSARVLEVDRNAIDNTFNQEKISKECRKGNVRIGDQSFIVDCDGRIVPYGN